MPNRFTVPFTAAPVFVTGLRGRFGSLTLVHFAQKSATVLT